MTNPTNPTQPAAEPSRATQDRTELALPGLLLGGVVIVSAFAALVAALSAVPAGDKALPDFDAWLTQVPNEPISRLQWIVGDITEPQFYKSWIASLGVLLGGAVGWWALHARKRWAGEPIAYGSGLWPWILGAAGLSLILSNLLFGSQVDGLPPTFVPFVCVASSVVLVYGAGWTKLLTGAILGVLTTPLAMVLIEHISAPLALPPVVANTASMSIGAAAVFLLCRLFPWMSRPELDSDSRETTEAAGAAVKPPTLISDAIWMVRRVITDFTETQFYANEWASIGLLTGVVITAVLNPEFAAYGSGLLPDILFAQALTSAVGIVCWRHLYRGGGWAPTYVSLVSVAPATVLAYGGSEIALVLGAVSGAVLGPIIARPISNALPDDFHPFIGNTIAMATASAVIVPAIGLIV